MIILLCFVTIVGMSNKEFQQEDLTTPRESISQDATSDFDKVMQVVTHTRCMNCHPSGDRPLQGDDSHLHYFNVQRGEDGHGMPAAQCNTCHHEENNEFSGVPGAPHWHLAPRSMGWGGLNRVQIARKILDPESNGGRTPEDIAKHMTEDALVLWAFEPGINAAGEKREVPPVSKEDYIKAVKNWIAAGAQIPNK